MKKYSVLKQFNWRIFLLRILANAIALILTVLILPDIYFLDFSIRSLLVVTLVLGVLNALVRPVLELLTIRLLFVSYGIVIVLVNMVILYMLAFLMPTRFSVNSLLWAFVGGLLIGIFGNFLENLLGITPPILPDEDKELRRQIEAQDVNLLEAWIQERKAARKQMLAEEQALAAEQALAEGQALADENAPASAEPEIISEPAEEGKITETDAGEEVPNQHPAVAGGEG